VLNNGTTVSIEIANINDEHYEKKDNNIQFIQDLLLARETKVFNRIYNIYYTPAGKFMKIAQDNCDNAKCELLTPNIVLTKMKIALISKTKLTAIGLGFTGAGTLLGMLVYYIPLFLLFIVGALILRGMLSVIMTTTVNNQQPSNQVLKLHRLQLNNSITINPQLHNSVLMFLKQLKSVKLAEVITDITKEPDLLAHYINTMNLKDLTALTKLITNEIDDGPVHGSNEMYGGAVNANFPFTRNMCIIVKLLETIRSISTVEEKAYHGGAVMTSPAVSPMSPAVSAMSPMSPAVSPVMSLTLANLKQGQRDNLKFIKDQLKTLYTACSSYQNLNDSNINLNIIWRITEMEEITEFTCLDEYLIKHTRFKHFFKSNRVEAWRNLLIILIQLAHSCMVLQKYSKVYNGLRLSDIRLITHWKMFELQYAGSVNYTVYSNIGINIHEISNIKTMAPTTPKVAYTVDLCRIISTICSVIEDPDYNDKLKSCIINTSAASAIINNIYKTQTLDTNSYNMFLSPKEVMHKLYQQYKLVEDKPWFSKTVERFTI
jgi:hypothetical protein